jgi:hypothetical protein
MRLSDMKPRADSAHRRNATGRQVIGEQLRGLHLRRIGVGLDQPVHRERNQASRPASLAMRPHRRVSALSKDATAATAATPATAPAVDHLMTRSAPVTAHRQQ